MFGYFNKIKNYITTTISSSYEDHAKNCLADSAKSYDDLIKIMESFPTYIKAGKGIASGFAWGSYVEHLKTISTYEQQYGKYVYGYMSDDQVEIINSCTEILDTAAKYKLLISSLYAMEGLYSALKNEQLSDIKDAATAPIKLCYHSSKAAIEGTLMITALLEELTYNLLFGKQEEKPEYSIVPEEIFDNNSPTDVVYQNYSLAVIKQFIASYINNSNESSMDEITDQSNNNSAMSQIIAPFKPAKNMVSTTSKGWKVGDHLNKVEKLVKLENNVKHLLISEEQSDILKLATENKNVIKFLTTAITATYALHQAKLLPTVYNTTKNVTKSLYHTFKKSFNYLHDICEQYNPYDIEELASVTIGNDDDYDNFSELTPMQKAL